MANCYDPKDVHVHAYKRTRFGRTEDVCEHWRSHPYQQQLTF
jgi:hypothetical protein